MYVAMKSILIFSLLILCLTLDGQERYTSVDGQKFRIKEFGKGTPTVIFESGMSDSLEAWGSIPDTVALFAHMFLYDRADIGKSDTSIEERTIPNMVKELKRILDQENIAPPFILVGHSLGGYITRYFSSQFPDDVKGLLLLDPSPEAYWESMSEKELKKYIAGGTEWYRTRFKPKYWKEWFRFIPNMVYMKNLNISKDLSIILVSATESNWYKYQKEQIKGFNNARQIEMTGGHYIHRNHPDLIVKYIRELASATAH
jgi:pimeloyl-ACP methyl ester carboxylesterase